MCITQILYTGSRNFDLHVPSSVCDKDRYVTITSTVIEREEAKNNCVKSTSRKELKHRLEYLVDTLSFGSSIGLSEERKQILFIDS